MARLAAVLELGREWRVIALLAGTKSFVSCCNSSNLGKVRIYHNIALEILLIFLYPMGDL